MANRIERFLENEEGIDIGNVVTKRNVSFLPFISTSFLKKSRTSSMILALFRLDDSRITSWRESIYIYIYIVESLA